MNEGGRENPLDGSHLRDREAAQKQRLGAGRVFTESALTQGGGRGGERSRKERGKKERELKWGKGRERKETGESERWGPAPWGGLGDLGTGLCPGAYPSHRPVP